MKDAVYVLASTFDLYWLQLTLNETRLKLLCSFSTKPRAD